VGYVTAPTELNRLNQVELLGQTQEEPQHAGWLRRHFHKYRLFGPWTFCWRITIEGLIVSLATAIPLGLFGLADRKFRMSYEQLFIFAVFVAPILETLLFQAFPVFIARWFRAAFRTQVAIATTVFALAHIPDGFGAFVAAGIVGGFYYGFTYVHWRERARWTAFWVTALSHSLHNLCIMLILLWD